MKLGASFTFLSPVTVAKSDFGFHLQRFCVQSINLSHPLQAWEIIVCLQRITDMALSTAIAIHRRCLRNGLHTGSEVPSAVRLLQAMVRP